MNALSKKEIVLISLMLFSMFFGAGNLIFPPFLGQSAGDQVGLSLAGFILSAVGLPILGVAAIAKAGSFYELAKRVHPAFASLFPLLIYVSIGPGLAIPRAGSLAYEMGMLPFLPQTAATQPVGLALYTLVFFGLVFWFSLSPSKLVDRFGKLMTPALLILLSLIFVKSLFGPKGGLVQAEGAYAAHPVMQGFLDGYLTMDALAALVFGIVVSNTLRSKGVTEPGRLSGYMMAAGTGAGILLAVIYLMLGAIGSTHAFLGKAENGAQLLTNVMGHLFGSSGILLLGVIFTVACLCVSIGLVTSCSQYFSGLFPRISYRGWVGLLCIVSMLIANMGLTLILKISVPILGAIYPVAIVLILFALAEPLLSPRSHLYVTAVGLVVVYGLLDLVNTMLLPRSMDFLLASLPLYSEGAGWVVPAFVGSILGFGVDLLRKRAY
ncbi:branched-chain amino acid transport system II carrier protein [Brevibacillus borstelensis]|jgi:LIVCS family branched-chain amino acid:cation transporter|uniref:Branched-chain amino acid transport system carrier protein n=1 Tax=Brevibacillus borstelensis AK1 TaxID=1300222 RepID=M8DVB4_9BACL|nr:branched-chain amino acid transport system II carrier protein [Brevibacillus borstelensis]EMT50941.1 branched-chain amino acid transporter carrier protein [Brevibacillus borstelensis AK1]MBE5394415.1 branched-chain amino acid transport system II carrier protein [Brevibacillus borstelensis]MCM3592273.1 branched-chain amino acid transport system II carrier protein [Brevibacillus borstelensis]MED1743950.1 branched-chain amino acid transport system II carrier protein [Brevibacillus borstelensis]